MGEIEYKRLRDLVREEKAQPSLVPLPPDFHSSVESFLNSRFGELEATRSVLQMREFENAVATIREICLIRQQKILFKAIRSGGSHGSAEEMTREEHALYDRFCGIIEEERGQLDRLLARYEGRKGETAHAQKAAASEKSASPAQNGETTVSTDAPVKNGDSALRRVRFLKDVPAYKGANSQTFGPYKPGEEGNLPPEEADWLLKGKLAENSE